MNPFSTAYHQDLKNFLKQIIPSGHRAYQYTNRKISGKHDYLILSNILSYKNDVQNCINKLTKHCLQDSRVVVISFNFLWKPIINLASKLGFRQPDSREPNWLSPEDINNLFTLEGFEEVIRGKRFLFPLNLGFFSKLINSVIAQLPLINHLCLTHYQVFRFCPQPKQYSVSIVIPARNEAGNIKGILNKIPLMGLKSEIIFVEGHSTDNTYQIIKDEIKNHKHQRHQAFLFKQKGKGKADAVRLGFDKAKNDLLMILDADLTVSPSDLPKFYRVLANGQANFANGSRLIYPMEKQAMRTLNYFGNKLFGLAFSYLLGQSIKDTLCGTKALLLKNYLKIKNNRKIFGDFDPFGDYDLLFGASKLNLKIVEIPVRYKERVYGSTNISRFTHGWLLLKMTFFAARKIKFI